MPRPHGSGCVLVALACAFSACSDPPDDTPLGRDIAAIMARPEHGAPKVRVQHVLVAFVGAKQGSESKRTYAEARTLTEELLQRARGGEDFAGLMTKYSSDDGGGDYTLTQAKRYDDYVENFHQVAFRLEVGEIGVAAHHRSKSPYGWHVIKRLE